MGLDSLDERYGRRPRRARPRLLAAAFVAFAVLVVAWATWAGLGISRATVTVRQVRVDTHDPAAATVSFEVTVASGRTAVCSVRATDASGAVVGWTDVTVPSAGPGAGAAAVTLRTSLPATDGGVGACVAR